VTWNLVCVQDFDNISFTKGIRVFVGTKCV